MTDSPSTQSTHRQTKRNRRAGVIDRWHTHEDLVDENREPIHTACKCRTTKKPSARHGKGLQYQARWVDDNGKEQGKSFRTKAEAKACADSETAKLETGRYVDPAKRGTTVAEIADSWAHREFKAVGTRTTYLTLVRAYILPTWGSTPIAEVKHSAVARWVTTLSATGSKTGSTLAPSTVRQAHKVFSQILVSAMRDGFIHANPADHVPLPRLPRKTPKFLTPVEVERVACAADYRAATKRPGSRTDLKPVAELPTDDDGVPVIPPSTPTTNGLIVRLLGATGLRAGELFGLRVGGIDLVNRKLHVVEGVVEVHKLGLVVGETKSHQERWVPFRSSLVEPLRVQIADKKPDEFLFQSAKGDAVRLRNWSRRYFSPAAALAGVSDDVTVHWLRHSAATQALAEGMNHVDVQLILGHASPSITMDVYAHVDPTKLKAIGDD